MKRIWLVSLAVVAAGCAVTPAEVREQGKVETINTEKRSTALAACLERNAQDNAFVPIRRRSTTGEEIIIGSPNSGQMITNAIFDIPETGQPTVTINPAVLTPEKFKTLMLAAC